jgi:lysozyme
MSSVAKLRLMNREKKMVCYYDDMGPGRGNCTIGIGHLIHKNPCTSEELARKVIEEDVMRYFDSDVLAAEKVVNRNLKVSLTQEQFDALVSYTFNRGPGGAHKVFELINRGELANAADEISSHVTASARLKKKSLVKVLPGLIFRRKEESAPFKNDVKR